MGNIMISKEMKKTLWFECMQEHVKSVRARYLNIRNLEERISDYKYQITAFNADYENCKHNLRILDAEKYKIFLITPEMVKEIEEMLCNFYEGSSYDDVCCEITSDYSIKSFKELNVLEFDDIMYKYSDPQPHSRLH